MKHRSRPPEQDDLLRPRLIDMIDPRHELAKLERVIEPESIICPCGCGDMVRIGEVEEDQETVRGTVSPTTDRAARLHPGALSGDRHDPPPICLPEGAHRCGASQSPRASA